MKSEHIPRATIKRLAIYVQILEDFHREGQEVISSETLAKACLVNPSQIRKDLAYFGEFGVRGVGYYVQSLISSIKRALGVDRVWRTALVGVGNLGRALLNHQDFKRRGFHIVAAYDCDPLKIGDEVAGLDIRCPTTLKDEVYTLGIEIGMVATPPERMQRAVDHLLDADIKGILSFTNARVKVPDNVVIEYVDFFHYLYAVAFNLTLSQTQAQAAAENN